MVYHTPPPLLEVARKEAMTPPRKKGSQATIPHPQITEIPYKLGKFIAQDALLAMELW